MNLYKILFIFSMALVAMSSCKDDDDVARNPLVGTWKMESARSETIIDNDGLIANYIFNYVSGDAFLDFKLDDSYEQSGMPVHESIIVISGDTFFVSTAPYDFSNSGTYMLRGDKISFDPSNQQSTVADSLHFTIDGDLLTFDLDEVRVQVIDDDYRIERHFLATTRWRRQ